MACCFQHTKNITQKGVGSTNSLIMAPLPFNTQIDPIRHRIKTPESPEAYRAAQLRRNKYMINQLRRNAGEYIPEEADEASKMRCLHIFSHPCLAFPYQARWRPKYTTPGMPESQQ
jgi:hypothetical protein